MKQVKSILSAAIVALTSTSALAQVATETFFPGYMFPTNVVEVNDTLDPNNPDVSGQYPEPPPIPAFVLRNYGASGPDQTNSSGWVSLTMEGDGSFVMQNIEKAIRRFDFDAAFTRQVFMVATPTAGEIELTGEPMMTFNGAVVGDSCCNSVGVGGYGSADLHIFDMNSPDPANFQTPQIGLQAFQDFWQIGTYAESNNPGYAGLSFYYDDFDTVEGGQAPVQFLPAPQDTLLVASSDGTLNGEGRVGVGVYPEATFHVGKDDGTTALLVKETGPVAARSLFQISNNGPTRFQFDNTDSGETWVFNAAAGELRIGHSGTGAVKGAELKVFANGNATLAGVLTQNSDVNAKQDVETVDQRSVLAKVMSLPIAEWSYKDAPESRHIGPMAQDFYRSFGLGNTDKGITSIDTAGVALAAIQGVQKEKNVQIEQLRAEKDGEIAALQAELRDQDERMMQLEMVIAKVLRDQPSAMEVSLTN